MKILKHYLPFTLLIACSPVSESEEISVSPVVGEWSLDQALVAFLDDDGSLQTAPTNIQAGELEQIDYIDATQEPFFVEIEMTFDLYENGQFKSTRYLSFPDGDHYEMDEGNWWLDEEYLNIKTIDRRLFINHEMWEDGTQFWDLDVDNPEFVDDSCLMTALLTRRL